MVQGKRPLEKRNGVSLVVTEMGPAASESMMPVGLNGREPQTSKPLSRQMLVLSDIMNSSSVSIFKNRLTTFLFKTAFS